MIVQACWDYKNPLLQLPHLTEDHLKYFRIKKVCDILSSLYHSLAKIPHSFLLARMD